MTHTAIERKKIEFSPTAFLLLVVNAEIEYSLNESNIKKSRLFRFRKRLNVIVLQAPYMYNVCSPIYPDILQMCMKNYYAEKAVLQHFDHFSR